MIMAPRLRKLALTAHVASSVGWLGAVCGFLALAITGQTSQNAQMVRAVDLTMALTTRFVIVPLAFAAVLTGIVQAVGTTWGLYRYQWVVVKLLLTVVATVVLLLKVDLISSVAAATVTGATLRQARTELVVHAEGGLVVLLVTTTLSVYKPWGKTRYGLRTQPAQTADSEQGSATSTRRWAYAAGIIALVLVFVFRHLAGGHGGHR